MPTMRKKEMKNDMKELGNILEEMGDVRYADMSSKEILFPLMDMH